MHEEKGWRFSLTTEANPLGNRKCQTPSQFKN